MADDADQLERQPRQGGERGDHIRRTPNRIWGAIITVILGFAAGGLGLIVREWWLIVVGAVVIVVGGIAAKAFGVMENTE